MGTASTPRYRARILDGDAEIEAALRLRARIFRGTPDAAESDCFDRHCRHVLVEERASGALVCCFRVLPFRHGGEIGGSYAAQYYGLAGLADYPCPMVELGRFCTAPGAGHPDILRTAWAALARIVDDEGAQMLFGCSSFHGTDARAYTDAFAMLRDRHLAPRRWLPRVKAPDVFRFARKLRRTPDTGTALRTMPPLLRSYIAMGGWVSDHAVVDRDLGTLHVFTGLEIKSIPPARVRALRGLSPA